MTTVGHRALFALRGDRAATLAGAIALVAHLPEVLWVGDEHLGHPRPVAPRAVVDLLGQAFDAVVIDVHDPDAGLDPDLLGACHGFVRGGGALVLRLPAAGEPPRAASLAAYPFARADVGTRFFERFERLLARAADPPRVLPIPPRAHLGTPEQAAVVAALVSLLAAPEPSCATLLADRGRGKSAALGLALAAAHASGLAPRVAITAASDVSLAEVLRFAPTSDRIAVVALADLLADVRGPDDASYDRYDLIVVDEAAMIPVPVLRRLARLHPRASLWLATTVRGYEGTGRGFVLRFVEWLRGERRPLHQLTLTAPIRWAAGDPLERFAFDALLLDAEPAAVSVASAGTAQIASLGFADRATGSGPRRDLPLSCERLDRDRLARDEADLRALFGLLVHAHYRTTPGDLQRFLDAPNLAVHVVRAGGAIVAATLVALEGDLAPALCDDVFRGRVRLRAHALPDALVAHLGRREAGALSMVRSVRIAVHPALRRAGLARRLVEHVHASYAPDLFGTLFGATADLVVFRREVGYELVRVSASRGARTGEPSLMMLRPVSPAARALVAALRAELARDLPLQLELLASELVLETDLVAALTRDLPPSAPLSSTEAEALVRAYAAGPRTLESIAAAAARFVADRCDRLAALAPPARAVIVTRILARASWSQAARAAGLAHAGQAMRLMRRALRELLAAPALDP